MNDLRIALDDLVADVELPPGLLDAVGAADRRHRIRITAAVLAVPVLVAAGVLAAGHSPKPRAVVRLDTTASPQPSTGAGPLVDGIRVRHVSAGFSLTALSRADRLNNPGVPTVEGIFSDGQGRSFGVSVQRGPVEDLVHLSAELEHKGSNRTSRPIEVSGHPALYVEHRAADPSSAGQIIPTFIDIAAGPQLTLSVAAAPSQLSGDELLAVAQGLVDEGPPPQPADPAAATAQIRSAFVTAFGPGTRAQRLAAVQDGEAIAAASPGPYEQYLDYSSTTVTAPTGDGLIFSDPTHAVLLWSASTYLTPERDAQPGAAVLIDGSWRVSSATWCTVVGLARCPTAISHTHVDAAALTLLGTAVPDHDPAFSAFSAFTRRS